MASVDTSIDSHATGAAASFAAAHAAEHTLKLYGGWFCPFVQRAWIVLHEKRAPHQYIEINPYRKAPEFLALNPRGLVPTLQVPGTDGRRGGGARVLYESLVVCEYLDEEFAGEGDSGSGSGSGSGRLLPEDTYERARCRLWIDHVSSRIVPSFYKFLQHTPDKPYSIGEARDEFLGHLKTFVKAMDNPSGGGGGGGGPWFLGDRFSLVDVALAPWAKRLFIIDHYKPGGVGIPLEGAAAGGGGEDGEVWARWKAWCDAVSERPSVRDTLSDEGEYIKIYRRYAEDTTQSLVGKATREGKPLP